MPTIFTPNGVRCELIYQYGLQRVENVYYVTKGSPATLADLSALYTLFYNWENGNAKNGRSGSVSLVLMSFQALDNLGSPFLEQVVSPGIQGLAPSPAQPPFVTIAVRHLTAKSGRNFRGRSYWVGIGAGLIDANGNVTVAQANAYAATYNTLRTQLAAAGWVFSICSQYSGVVIVNGHRRAVPRAAGILTPVTSSTCEVGTDTNRHRKLPHAV